jgi:uncharacterized protein (DUF736 family)
MDTNTKPTPQVKTSAQTQTQAQNDWDKREIGALWKREGKSQNYLSGHVKFSDEFGAERKLDVMIFANKSKKKDTHPDFRIYFNDRPAPKTSEAPVVSNKAAKPAPLEEELI